jgi:hypothetical protein
MNFAMIRTMNWRAGFQRVYAVLSVVWIAVVLLAAPTARLKFWATEIDYDALAQQARSGRYRAEDIELPPGAKLTDPGEWLKKHATDSQVSPAPQRKAEWKPPPQDVFTDIDIAAHDSQASRVSTPQSKLSIVKSEPLPITESRLSKIRWLSAMLFLPPVVGYILLFHVFRWVYRGFKPLAKG